MVTGITPSFPNPIQVYNYLFTSPKSVNYCPTRLKEGLVILKNESTRITDNDEVLNAVRDGAAHYITWAKPGLTYAAFFCEQGLSVNADT